MVTVGCAMNKDTQVAGGKEEAAVSRVAVEV